MSSRHDDIDGIGSDAPTRKVALAPVTALTAASAAETSGEAPSAQPAREALVARAIAGDSLALYDLCQEIAKGVLFRTLRSMDNHQDAEDAAQEILLRVCSRISTLNDPKAFNGWLNSIIINETRRIATKSARQASILDINDYLDEFIEEKEDFLPLEYTLREEDRKALIGIVDSLPQRQRDAVVLHYYEGFSVTEVAEIMGISHQGTSRYLKLAREKVKGELSRQSDGRRAANNLAALPTGALLAASMQQDSLALAPTHEAWLSQTIDLCAETLGVKLPEAAASQATKAVIAGIAASLLATASITFGALMLNQPSAPPAIPATEQAVDYGGRVAFSGGQPEDERYNPSQAIASGSTEHGAMTPLDWQITESGSDAVLYSGSGGVVDSALAELKASGLDGEYILHFTMQDAQGDTYILSASFYIVTRTD